MAFCEHCGGEIIEGAQYCPSCGQARGNVRPAPAAPRKKKGQPIIGFIGMLTMGAGVCVMLIEPGLGFAILAVGILILIYALFTGDLKFFG